MNVFADLADMQSDLESLLQQHATNPVQLIVVPDPAGWAAAHAPHLPEFRWAIALRDEVSGSAAIVARQHFTKDQASSIVGRVAISCVEDAFHLLSSPQQFAKHLVLHELAHIENGWGQDRESDCDRWAMERLPAGA